MAAIPFGSGDKIQEACSFGPIEDLVYKTIQTICDEKGLVILEMNGKADHVHILFEADPFTCVGELVNVIKTKTSRFARKQYGDTLLKPYYWKPLFWSDSYFVTSVSENSLTHIKTYIQNQWRHSPTPILTDGRGTLPFLIEKGSIICGITRSDGLPHLFLIHGLLLPPRGMIPKRQAKMALQTRKKLVCRAS